ncbi:hypothetical protein [Kineosporia sp. NBRC 101677]|uniref:hypothetical protein n=1 Tax=Kineosporia sp. NBRC 101677 TaxID=3032197 RepID=UPI00255704EB|nr:hypothetical protein [Kineosporia sp. NBRC 101677]
MSAIDAWQDRVHDWEVLSRPAVMAAVAPEYGSECPPEAAYDGVVAWTHGDVQHLNVFCDDRKPLSS